MDDFKKSPSSNELYHYGVLGMKWGVRRYQDYSGRLLPKGKKAIKKTMQAGKRHKKEPIDESKRSEDSRRYQELKKKPVYQMSNKDLNDYLTRASLESRYANLNPTLLMRGKKLVETYVMPSVKGTSTKTMNKATQSLLDFSTGKYDDILENLAWSKVG